MPRTARPQEEEALKERLDEEAKQRQARCLDTSGGARPRACQKQLRRRTTATRLADSGRQSFRCIPRTVCRAGPERTVRPSEAGLLWVCLSIRGKAPCADSPHTPLALAHPCPLPRLRLPSCAERRERVLARGCAYRR